MAKGVDAITGASAFVSAEVANAVTSFVAPVGATLRFARRGGRQTYMVAFSTLAVLLALLQMPVLVAAQSSSLESETQLALKTKPHAEPGLPASLEFRATAPATAPFAVAGGSTTNAALITDVAHWMRDGQALPIRFRIFRKPSAEDSNFADWEVRNWLLLADNNPDHIGARLQHLETVNRYKRFNIRRVVLTPKPAEMQAKSASDALPEDMKPTEPLVTYAALKNLERVQGSPIEVSGIENPEVRGKPVYLSALTSQDLRKFLIKAVEIRADPADADIANR
jgi:hypothetical protein